MDEFIRNGRKRDGYYGEILLLLGEFEEFGLELADALRHFGRVLLGFFLGHFIGQRQVLLQQVLPRSCHRLIARIQIGIGVLEDVEILRLALRGADAALAAIVGTCPIRFVSFSVPGERPRHFLESPNRFMPVDTAETGSIQFLPPNQID